MKKYNVYKLLKKVEENDVIQLIDLWNERCQEWRYDDDMIFPNDTENLKMLLPSDPEEAFAMGRATSDNYNYSDEWLSLDGYERPVTCDTYNLTDKFISLDDLASYLAEEKEDDELEELFANLDAWDEDEPEEA